jgi:hypothetical protein
MLFNAGINSAWNKFLHLFAAANYRNLLINYFLNDVTAMAASIKLY